MTNPEQSNHTQNPTAIGRLLTAFIDNKKWRSKLELHRVFEFWNNTVGPDIAAVAQPSIIRGHVLWVKVTDSVWMQQLHMQKILLLNKINEHLHEEISDIRFQLNSSLAPPPAPEKKKTEPVCLDRKKELEFDKLISSLENDDLKVSLKSLWVKMQKKG